ncbi:hypothetical protein [Hafnia alvei]|uniref:hypothetical protein n=1 Tax=Hafnia alvei TaxID=569 RepID=UPI0012D4701E|nr:hypothetical protein [Hafnia alvei]NEY29026.1 hypothetical protein [Escherichia coli]
MSSASLRGEYNGTATMASPFVNATHTRQQRPSPITPKTCPVSGSTDIDGGIKG